MVYFTQVDTRLKNAFSAEEQKQTRRKTKQKENIPLFSAEMNNKK